MVWPPGMLEPPHPVERAAKLYQERERALGSEVLDIDMHAEHAERSSPPLEADRCSLDPREALRELLVLLLDRRGRVARSALLALAGRLLVDARDPSPVDAHTQERREGRPWRGGRRWSPLHGGRGSFPARAAARSSR